MSISKKQKTDADMRYLNKFIKPLASLILLLSIVGCSDKEKENETESASLNLFEYRAITVIVPNVGGRTIRGPVLDEAKLFSEKTGASVRVVTPGWKSTIGKIKESLTDPKINFDIFVIITSWGGSLLGENHIEPIPEWVKEKIEWKDVLPVYKNSILSWGNKPYGLPYDGDCVNLYYRKDIFANNTNQEKFFKKFGYKLTPPTTWDMYEDIAKFFDGWDWDDDGKIEHGIAENRLRGYGSVLQFFTRAAAYAKHPDDKAYYFDIATMKPRINNPGFVEAFEDYINIMKYGPKEMLNLQTDDIRKSFISGDVAMAIDWADMGPMAVNSDISVVKDRVGYAALPGYDRVYNNKTKKWDSQYNNPSSIAGNWTILVNKDSKDKKLAFEFAAHMTSPILTKKLITIGWTGINPSRYSHFEDMSDWDGSGFSPSDTREYLNTISKSLDNENVMVDIRIPGASKYYDVAGEYIDLALKGKMEPKEALDKISLKWDEITDSLGRKSQIQLYKKSVNY